MLLAGHEITANPFASVGDIAKSKKVDIVIDLMAKLNMLVQSHLPPSKDCLN
jgi:hypothetical protein